MHDFLVSVGHNKMMRRKKNVNVYMRQLRKGKQCRDYYIEINISLWIGNDLLMILVLILGENCVIWIFGLLFELNHFFRFKMSVVITNCTHIKEWNKVVKCHSNFTKITLLYKKKTNLKLHWKLCERKVRESKVGRKN